MLSATDAAFRRQVGDALRAAGADVVASGERTWVGAPARAIVRAA